MRRSKAAWCNGSISELRRSDDMARAKLPTPGSTILSAAATDRGSETTSAATPERFKARQIDRKFPVP